MNSQDLTKETQMNQTASPSPAQLPSYLDAKVIGQRKRRQSLTSGFACQECGRKFRTLRAAERVVEQYQLTVPVTPVERFSNIGRRNEPAGGRGVLRQQGTELFSRGLVRMDQQDVNRRRFAAKPA